MPPHSPHFATQQTVATVLTDTALTTTATACFQLWLSSNLWYIHVHSAVAAGSSDQLEPQGLASGLSKILKGVVLVYPVYNEHGSCLGGLLKTRMEGKILRGRAYTGFFCGASAF